MLGILEQKFQIIFLNDKQKKKKKKDLLQTSVLFHFN